MQGLLGTVRYDDGFRTELHHLLVLGKFDDSLAIYFRDRKASSLGLRQDLSVLEELNAHHLVTREEYFPLHHVVYEV